MGSKSVRYSGKVATAKDFTQYILKFKDSDVWPTAEIEYVYYQMAVDSGIDMEKSSLLTIAGTKHFLTERFDRKHGSKQHSATLRSLCGEVTSYDELFGICRSLGLPYRDLEQVFRRAVFNYLAGVSDDHDKNFSFLMSEKGVWSLSPAYDETFTVNYKNRFIGDRHAMTIAGNDRLVSRDQLLKFASENDIRNADDIIDEVISTLMTFEQKAADAGIDVAFIEIISEYISSQINKVSRKNR
jgi:serine/threonine-protein kinase HipA